MVRQIVQLGYRGDVHYVGMSHYMRLEALGGGYYINLAGGVLNRPTAGHRALATACGSGLGIIWSLSYELFDAIAGTTGNSAAPTAQPR